MCADLNTSVGAYDDPMNYLDFLQLVGFVQSVHAEADARDRE